MLSLGLSLGLSVPHVFITVLTKTATGLVAGLNVLIAAVIISTLISHQSSRKCDSTSVGVSLMYVPAHMLTAHGSLLATLPVGGMLPDLSTMLSKPIEAMTKTTNIRPKL